MDTNNLLPAVTGALTEYGPKVLQALIILVVAWIIAKLLASAVRYAIGKLNFGEESARTEMKSAVGGATFWVVMLIAIPMVLEPLGMQSILQPLQNMANEFLTFLPKLIAAIAIFAIGYVVATVARKAISGVLSAAKADEWAARTGLGDMKVSSLVGTLVFAVLIIPISIAALDALDMQSISGPAKEMLQTFMAAIPNIIGACIVLGLSYVIARFASGILGNVLPNLGLDNVAQKMGLSAEVADGGQISKVISGLVFAIIVIFGLIEATEMLNFEILSQMLAEVLGLGARVLLGSVIIGAGVIIANLITGFMAKTGAAGMTGLIRVAVIVLAGAMGLRQMGLANEIVDTGFTLMLGAIAVAVALAFGLGGREAAGKLFAKWTKNL